MEQQFIVIHMIHQTEIPALLDSWIRTTPSAKTLRVGVEELYIFVKT